MWLRTFEFVTTLQSKFLFYGMIFRALHKPQLSNISSIFFFFVFTPIFLQLPATSPLPWPKQPQWFGSIVTWISYPVFCLKEFVHMVHSKWEDSSNPSAGSTSFWLLDSNIICSAILFLTWLSWSHHTFFWVSLHLTLGVYQVALVVKNPPANTGKIPWGGHGNSLQYSCLENAMERRAW